MDSPFGRCSRAQYSPPATSFRSSQRRHLLSSFELHSSSSDLYCSRNYGASQVRKSPAQITSGVPSGVTSSPSRALSYAAPPQTCIAQESMEQAKSENLQPKSLRSGHESSSSARSLRHPGTAPTSWLRSSYHPAAAAKNYGGGVGG
jgi:hypothetical protein